MNVIQYRGPMELVVIGLEPGEMLLESINEAIREHDILNGVVVSGIGTLKNLHMHFITHTDFPPADEFVNIAEPLELVSVSGIIADGRPHLHVAVSCKDRQTWCGHLEPGSEVAYLAEIVILKCNQMRLTRRLDPDRKVSLLGPQDGQ